MPRRFRETFTDSFFGTFIYDAIIPRDHFWSNSTASLPGRASHQPWWKPIRARQNGGEVPYHPVLILTMLLLSYLYDISERRTEEFCTYYLPAKAFLGLGVTEPAPDHSTLTAFKTRLLDHSGSDAYHMLLDSVITQAQAAGIQFGDIQLVDAVHTVANVNNEKDRKRQEQGRPRPILMPRSSTGEAAP